MENSKFNCGYENARSKLDEIFRNFFEHDGYANLQVDIKILKKGQKEIIIRAGKEYRYVADYIVDTTLAPSANYTNETK
jgi:hypothetical protein